MGSSTSKAAAPPALALPATAAVAAANSDVPPAKPKPCCVCLDEKDKRDKCMLFSNAADPAQECQSTIEAYKTCMKGFGFEV